VTSTDESNLNTAGMAATTCSPKPNAGQMTGPAACAVRVRSAFIPATLSARCSKAMIAGSPVAAASHGSPNGLDRLALASALAEYRIRRKQALGGLTHEYYFAA